MNRIAAKRFWMKNLRPAPGTKFLEEITDGLEAHLEWGVLKQQWPPTAIKFLLDQRWKDPLPPTVRQLTVEYERDPAAFFKERNIARMKCAQRGWGYQPTPRQEALSAMRIPLAWLQAQKVSVDTVKI